ncbi:High-density lipoprotein receptor (Hdl) [Fasciolopsis buskii]|uniref:High-density lipoprotein receptor (Hdl) n=1 Tax=Fasciolopsis buskii TaxID=27845 RepID=A0A8E0S602_9TREM|nr:High-density lipoprotein receptor (Hdl) [Fasciolopsis buski]
MHACAPPHQEPPSSGEIDRDQEYPALLKGGKPVRKFKSDALLPAYHCGKITEVVEIPCEQRRDDAQPAGRRVEAQSRICSEIVKETGVDINLTCSKTNTLTIVLSGQPEKVAVAKRSLIAELQQQESAKIVVPQEFLGFLIGKKGEKLRDLQSRTMTRITIPPSRAADSNTIVISGPKQGVAEAEQFIRETVTRQAQLGFERLDIPKVFHPFIFGPNGKTLDDIRARTDTKINVPPPAVQGSVITITGKREGVAQAAAELQQIHEEAKLCKTIPVRVKRSQHRLIFGPRGSGLAEILSETGVSVELPTDPASEEIILRGKPEDLGRALTMVYERAESSTAEEIYCPNRFHKLLIGKRGAALNELISGYERVHIEFGEHRDKILLEGPPEEVGFVMERLKARIAELEASIAMEKIRVDPKYFRHIVGKQGATILRWRENRVQINLPSYEKGDHLAADEIVIEGDPQGVERTKREILQLVEKLENEKCKDMIIEPHVQNLLCTGYKGIPPPIRIIYDNFPKVSVIWPDNQDLDDRTTTVDNPVRSVVQLRGDRQQVDAAAERLQKLIKQVIDENHRQEIRIFKEFRPHIFGRGSTKIQKLLDDTKTRIQYPNPSDGSDVFTIIGREENVQQAIQQLEDLQKNLANVKEIIVPIPSELTTKFVGDQAPSLRSIREQCAGVHMRFVHASQKHVRKGSQVEVVMIGPSDALDEAKKLLEQLNAKVAQLCAEVSSAYQYSKCH